MCVSLCVKEQAFWHRNPCLSVCERRWFLSPREKESLSLFSPKRRRHDMYLLSFLVFSSSPATHVSLLRTKSYFPLRDSLLLCLPVLMSLSLSRSRNLISMYRCFALSLPSIIFFSFFSHLPSASNRRLSHRHEAIAVSCTRLTSFLSRKNVRLASKKRTRENDSILLQHHMTLGVLLPGERIALHLLFLLPVVVVAAVVSLQPEQKRQKQRHTCHQKGEVSLCDSRPSTVEEAKSTHKSLTGEQKAKRVPAVHRLSQVVPHDDDYRTRG